jgi:type II secretory pathway pseudopilin PulG
VTERAGEAGFGLLELVVCVALLVSGGVVALALLPPLVRASQASLMRDAAADVARNALERARAAAAYYPPPAVADAAARAAATAAHAWVFAPAASDVAAARIERGLCGSAAAWTDVPMNVATTYDAAGDRLTVTVAYPPDPCAPAVQATVALSAQLAPASYAPQTELDAAIADPARQ